jgi:hypothetical protein
MNGRRVEHPVTMGCSCARKVYIFEKNLVGWNFKARVIIHIVFSTPCRGNLMYRSFFPKAWLPPTL